MFVLLLVIGVKKINSFAKKGTVTKIISQCQQTDMNQSYLILLCLHLSLHAVFLIFQMVLAPNLWLSVEKNLLIEAGQFAALMENTMVFKARNVHEPALDTLLWRYFV